LARSRLVTEAIRIRQRLAITFKVGVLHTLTKEDEVVDAKYGEKLWDPDSAA